ncbi:hypothetical protein AB0368_03130 [Actinoplanes sp. NPDC051475]|uniref:hypothetical protein n=1 Tax=Actinoplanes sp. NPDC051475 TaxID=3157225 RepID=UPI00344EFBD7
MRNRGLILLAAGFGVGMVVRYSQFLLFAAALAATAAVAAWRGGTVVPDGRKRELGRSP